MMTETGFPVTINKNKQAYIINVIIRIKLFISPHSPSKENIMDKGKYKVDTEKRLVTFGHVTKTMDGSIALTTTFDYSKVDLGRLLYEAGSHRLITWRAASGIKSLTTEEAKKLDNITLDCSVTIERKKHVETAEETELKATLKALLSGQNGAKLSVNDILKKLKELQATDEMEAGETTE